MPYLFASLSSSVRQAVQTGWKKASRQLLRLRMFRASEAEKLAAERVLRGAEQYRKLRRADVVVVSFGKSGRTWLRVMLSRLYQQIHGLPERALIGFDNFHNMNAAVPRLFFTHDNYIEDYTGRHDSRTDFYDRRVVLLVRDPRDVAVSQYFQWKHRMKPGKKAINQYPGEADDINMFEFVLNHDAGLARVIRFMNLWAQELPRVSQHFLLRYEDLKTDTEGVLTRLSDFLGTGADRAQILDAVAFSSYDNMKKMEASSTFWLSGGRMVPRDRENPDSYKVRRAKVGGYRDYFDDAQVAAIDARLAQELSPVYGYGAEPAPGAKA